MLKLLRILFVLASFATALASLSSCSPNSGSGTYLPVPDVRVELFTNQNNSGKDDDYERKWRHGGNFRPVRASADSPVLDVFVNSEGLKINLPAAGEVSISVYDETGVLVISEYFYEIENGDSVISRVPYPGSYRVEVAIDGIVYSGVFLK